MSLRERLERVHWLLKVFRQFLKDEEIRDPRNDEMRMFLVAEKMAMAVDPKAGRTEAAKIWLDDQGFLTYFRRFCGANLHSADRKFFLRSLLGLVNGLDGDTAECGAFEGATSYLICEHVRDMKKTHHVFDSCEGLSEPTSCDGTHWSKHALCASEETLRSNLAGFPRMALHKGWIPQPFAAVKELRFCFVHVDVDLYEPTRESLEFFYPRMVSNGVILCDDYGFSTCPGAKKAFDEYFAGRPERVIHVPTGQAFVLKRP